MSLDKNCCSAAAVSATAASATASLPSSQHSNTMSDSEEIEDITPNGQQQQQDPNEGLHPLFWDSIPDNAEEHPDYIALKALDDETTPEERAENFKVRQGRALHTAAWHGQVAAAGRPRKAAACGQHRALLPA